MIIKNRKIGRGHPTYFIAEMSGNHGQDYARAEALVREAKAAGADAFKMQTYTADTITMDCDKEWFTLKKESTWAGRTLYELYKEAYTPWEWQPRLKKLGDELGIEIFSTPFDDTSVDFLEQEVGVNAYKIASFEIIDIPLLKKVASTGKPVIVSTGLASVSEVELAVETLRDCGAGEIALLHCVSSYPASPEQMNLATIPDLADRFSVISGLSDHSLSPAVPVTAVALGASIVEKHFTLRRSDGGPDALFSLEPKELKELVNQIRQAEAAIGGVHYGVHGSETESADYRKSVFASETIEEGEMLTRDNIRVIRPGYGLKPVHFEEILGRKAAKRIDRGTPLSWDLISEGPK